jgi:single-strand DNA-binding protein
VAASIHKGQPVVVVGRLRQREYEKDGHMVQVVDVDADLVGHDLSRGTAQFVRSRRGPQTADLARESVVATELSGDGDTRSTHVADGTGWAVPGLSAVGTDPVPESAADPAA